ncbi:hypothetical protein H5410_002230 [Solanum commersonii]|uniref:Uncharacterized protein n=1 Tax=Solanum commersonii TaxID=4109 RepID=A0A9J6B1D6_SOLCO|nr:hypothetical protein H5410_002230 [Solanum commersonii]
MKFLHFVINMKFWYLRWMNFIFLESQNIGLLVVTYSHHLHQLQELNNSFGVMSGNLLLCMTSLNSANAFADFNKEKIMTVAKHYPNEFGEPKLQDLSHQLNTFVIDMWHENFTLFDLKGIGYLAEALVNANLNC